MPTVKLTFYALLFGLAIYVVRLDFLTGLQAVPSWYLWGNVLALAALPTAVSLLCTTQAIHYIGSTPTAILGALEPVTAVFFGVVIFHEELTARLGLGIALILVAVTLIVAGGRFASFLLRFRRLFPKRHRKNGSLSSGFRSGGACSVYSNHPRMAAIASSRIGSGRVAMRVRCDPPGCTKSFMLRLRGVTAHAAPDAVHGSLAP